VTDHVVILGAGLAGLACGYELAREGVRVTVLEREPDAGGMASSFVEADDEYWSYDFGPHRFHTHDDELVAHVKEILDGNYVDAKRLSRIVLYGKFFDYPLKAGNVVRNLPPRVLLRAFADYLWVRFTERTGLSHYSDDTFEGWVTKRFGKRLYDLFFGEYTAKAWKMPPSQISGDWASQRISLLSLSDAVKKSLIRPRRRDVPRSLVTDFIYPKWGGIGSLSRGYVRRIEELGGAVICNAPAVKVHTDDRRVTGVEYGARERSFVEGDHYISTIPITALARAVRPAAPEEVRHALAKLRYVSILFVYLKVDKPHVTPDSWVYVPERHLTVHRLSEFKNFSPHAAPPGKTMVCAEITCRQGDEHWRARDEELSEIATSDLVTLGLLDRRQVLGAFVKRVPFAYPVYDLEYKEHLLPILDFVHSLENIQTGGRQGLFRYNNMDQSIEMGRRMGWGLLAGATGRHEEVATGSEYFG